MTPTLLLACVGEADDLLSLEAEVLPMVAADEDAALSHENRLQIELGRAFDRISAHNGLAKCPFANYLTYGSSRTKNSSLAKLQDVLPLTEESPKEEALAEQAEHPLED